MPQPDRTLFRNPPPGALLFHDISHEYKLNENWKILLTVTSRLNHEWRWGAMLFQRARNGGWNLEDMRGPLNEDEVSEYLLKWMGTEDIDNALRAAAPTA